MYGKTIKYVIPEFTPSAIVVSPFSTTALHIAHCAFANNGKKASRKKMDIFKFLCIIRRDHYINNYTAYRNI